MNAKKIASTLKSLQAKKASLETKRAEMIKQLDEEIAATAKDIQNYSKILEKIESLQKAANEQLALAESLMKDGKKEPKSSKKASSDGDADADDIFSE